MNSQAMGRKADFVRRCVFVLCLAALPALCGCVVLGIAAGAAAGAGAAVYLKGNLTQTVNASEKKVHEATLLALKDLQLPVLEDRADMMTAKITSEFSDGKRLWLELESVNPESTKICLRVGFWGDEQRAREVLQKIQSHLGM